MVWFQCEDCGDNLKKPKLPNHFRTCSAHKLSCIDCGQIFGRDTVQDHTQCITEAEKYGPKGPGKALNGTTAKLDKDRKQRPEVDIHVGLSERPPWFCSLCNTKATSQQTLLLHADGKKHRVKARAFHTAKQQSVLGDKSAPAAKLAVENASSDEVRDDKNAEHPNLQGFSKQNDLKPENENTSKKRKFDALEDDPIKKNRNVTSVEMGNGEIIQVEGAEAGAGESHLKKERIIESHCISDIKMKIKWKKFIKSALKSNPDGILKMKKLRKLVVKAMREAGVVVDETEFREAFQQKINSSSRFAVEKQYVRLVAKLNTENSR